MPSKDIFFDSIPSSIRKPGRYAEFNLALAVRALPGNLQKTLIIAPRLATGIILANQPTDVFSSDQAALYFGRGSIAHRMVKAALRANPYLSLQVIAVDDAASAVAAAGALTFTGNATGVGVISVQIGDELVQVSATSGDTPAVVAATLKTALDNLPDLPVAAAVNAGTLTLTARNHGTLGNGIKLSAVCSASGMQVAVTAMAGGAIDPTLPVALATIWSAGHNVLVSPWSDQTTLTALRDHLDAVGGPLEKRGAVLACAFVGTLSAATTVMNAVNAGRISGILVPNTSTPQFEVAAIYGAVIAGEEDPARPLNTLPLLGVSAPPLANQLGRTEQENCLYNGVTPAEVGPGNLVQIVRSITGYTRNAAGIPDPSLLDITTIRTLDYTRKAIVDRLGLRFPRAKRSARVRKQVREEVLDVLYKLEELEILEDVEANEDRVLVQDDLQDANRVNIRIPADVVNGLHVIGMVIDLLL